MPRFGVRLNLNAPSTGSWAIVEPTLGLDGSDAPTDVPFGGTPATDNFIMREGALEPRPMLSLRTETPHQLGDVPVLGLAELVSVTNDRTVVASSQSLMAVYGQSQTPNGWSALSYVSAAGINDPPQLGAHQRWDYAQTYWAERDENVLYMAAESYQTLYCTMSDTTVFSTMTGAPRARFVASLDNYVMAFNLQEGSARLVQRAQWNYRGSAASWTGGLSGFEDLLSMRGEGKRIVVQDNRFLLASDEEWWQGTPGNDVFPWTFTPYDTSRGAPYSWTVCNTPLGHMFLGKDYQVYLLPKGGGPSRPIGQRLHREVRRYITNPERAWSVFNNTEGLYQLHYAIKGGSGEPQRAAYLNVETGAWAPQSFDSAGGGISLTRGVEILLSSSATTWGGAQASGITFGAMTLTYLDMTPSKDTRAVLVGSSKGTLYYLNSTATSDNGTGVDCRWRSTGLGGEQPDAQKTFREFRVDYQADSASSMTVKFSQTLGASNLTQMRLDLPATSQMSQAIGYPYFTTRYPTFEVSVQGFRPRLQRFWGLFVRSSR